MAAIPAPMPAAMSTRRSTGRSRSRLPSKEPKPAPIWAMGPSRPPDPPVPSVIALATIFTRGTRPDLPLMIVIGRDRRIGAVPLGFRGQRVDDDPADEAADRRDQDQEPRNDRVCRNVQPRHRRLAARPGLGVVACHDAQRIMFHDSRGKPEDNRTQTRYNANQPARLNRRIRVRNWSSLSLRNSGNQPKRRGRNASCGRRTVIRREGWEQGQRLEGHVSSWPTAWSRRRPLGTKPLL